MCLEMTLLEILEWNLYAPGDTYVIVIDVEYNNILNTSHYIWMFYWHPRLSHAYINLQYYKILY